ncbi:MAG: DNA alkylation repair protein [Bacillota bacterium]
MSGIADPASLVARVKDFCVANADPKVIAKYGKYFKEGYDPYGVAFDQIASEAKRILEEYRAALGFHGFFDLADALMESGKYEESCFAIRFVTAFKDQFSVETVRRIGKWFDGKVVNWAVSDGICGDILAPLVANGTVALDELAPWRSAADRFKRRAVPVAMLDTLKRDFDPAPLLDFIRPMMADQERVVHQGLGWFLREIWKKRPTETEAFLLEHRNTAARLIFQYATEKMTPEQKGRFRRDRITANKR